MFKELAVAGVLLLAAGCASGTATPAKTVTVTPTPTISWDEQGKIACQMAAKDAYLAAQASAKLSAITELQDLALRETQLQNVALIKDWCAKNYHG